VCQLQIVSAEGFTPLCCAETVSKLHLFEVLGLLFERKQIPQIVVIVRIQRKTMEPLEQTTVPWAQGTALLSYL
jgi:hypothetical protein